MSEPGRVLAIDPGPVESGVVLLDTRHDPPQVIRAWKRMPTDKVVELLRDRALGAQNVAVEMIASYGVAVGETVFETCVWIGRMLEAAAQAGCVCYRVKRLEVKMALCHNTRANDSNIRQAILDLYPGTGGGSTPQVGTKKQPGPLYGVAKDAWAAVALGIAWARQQGHIAP